MIGYLNPVYIMQKVTGLGGIFIKCRDRDKTREWYQTHLGINMDEWGAQLNWNDDPHQEPYSILGFFRRSTDYFDPSEQPFMINLRVADLEGLIAELKAAGVTLIGGPLIEEYGKFAWILDPEGNKIELWEQAR